MSKDFLNTLKVINDIVIHTCCADCFLNSLKYLKKNGCIDENSTIISLFYNPNIHPRSEYLERLKAVKDIINDGEFYENKNINTKIVIPDYRPKEYFKTVDKYKIKNKRCQLCWDLRIRYLFDYAKEMGIGVVTTTLLTSNLQNRDEIIRIGKKYEEKYSIKFLEINSDDNIKNVGFYKQNYCGCCFSLVEKMTKEQT